MRITAALLSLAVVAASCRGPAFNPAADLDKKVEVTFVGLENVTEVSAREVVANELAGLEGRRADKAAIDDSAYALELHYRSEGYPNVYVDYEFTPVEGGTPRAVFLVDEGTTVFVERFDVTGVGLFDEDEVESFLTDIGPGEPYVLARAQAVVRKLRNVYLAKGYLNVVITGPEVEFTDENAARLSLMVDEGPRFVVRQVNIEGELQALEGRLAEFARRMIGTTFTPHVTLQLRSVIVELHGQRGYPDCAIEPSIDRDEETGAVAITLSVDTGEMVRIKSVRIVGNKDISEKRIRSRIELEPGDRYDSRELEESFRRLYSTGLFDLVRLTLEEESGSERTLVAEVIESPTLQFFVEPGWGSYEGPRIRVGIDERNVFGTGRRGRIDAHYSALDQGVELLVADPWLFDAEIIGQTNVFANRREEPSFTQSDLGLGFSVRRAWSLHSSATLGYEFTRTELSDVQIGAILPPEATEDANFGSVIFTLVHDRRDNILMPRSGGSVRFISSLSADALGSEVDLFENGVDFMGVTALGEETILAGSARLTVVAPYGRTTVVPLQRRAFNGGENTVRSFRESELGPRDPTTGNPVGGEARTVFNVELRHQLSGNFSGALFVDTGNVVPEWENLLRADTFRHGVGVGVRYLLPIGPLRFDYAVNPDPRLGEDEWVLHFAVGLPF